MADFRVSNIRKEYGDEGPDFVGVTTLTSQHYMVPPSGTTEERPVNPEVGTLRFNTDSGTLEFYRGDTIGWENIVRTSPDLGGGTGSNEGVGARGLYMGGATPTLQTQIDYITISTLGDAEDFGDLSGTRSSCNSFGSRIRAAACGGQSPSTTDDTLTIMFSTKGETTTDYATHSAAKKEAAVVNDRTRAVHCGGGNTVMEYITIEQGGTWIDFGNLQVASEQCMDVSSSTRGVVAEGSNVPAGLTNRLDYFIIQSTGNATDFGDTTDSRYGGSSGSNSTRGIFAGGWAPNVTNRTDYIEMATTGNALDWADLTEAKYSMSGSCSSKIRMVSMGGHKNPNPATDVMEYFTFSTKGNGVDFGNLTTAKSSGGSCSNDHGGV